MKHPFLERYLGVNKGTVPADSSLCLWHVGDENWKPHWRRGMQMKVTQGVLTSSVLYSRMYVCEKDWPPLSKCSIYIYSHIHIYIHVFIYTHTNMMLLTYTCSLLWWAYASVSAASKQNLCARKQNVSNGVSISLVGAHTNVHTHIYVYVYIYIYTYIH